MGRRLVGGALVGIGLFVASLTWVGFGALRTVLDAGRSDRVAEALYEDREVRDQMRTTIADGLDAAIPNDIAVPRQELLDAAEAALDDPAVEAVVRDGLVRSHQRFLGQDPNPDEPIVVDAAAIGAAARTALVTARPDLAPVVPPPPSLPITLPTEVLPDASGFRRWLVGTVALGALAATGLVVAAFVITDNRHRVLRRVGWWGIGAGAAWVVIGVALPELAKLMLPGQAAIFAAIIGVMAGGMVGPSITAMVAGAAAVVVGFLWWGVARVARRSGGRAPAPAPYQQGAYPPGAYPPSYAPPSYHPPAAAPPGYASGSSPTGQYPSVTPAAPPRPGADPTRVAGADPTRVTGGSTPPGGTPAPPAGAPWAPPPPAPDPAPRWVDGVGYVDD
ncbi:MAG TPA: hypothetical protein VK866_03670 [Acidimicrobiales bacterium]|nr:hypothetical protein [Acidimicrobiales bacterium]